MSHSHPTGNKYIYYLQEFSIPLLLGVVVALVHANQHPESYKNIVHHTVEFVTGTVPSEGHGKSHEAHSEKHDDHKDGDHKDDAHKDDKDEGSLNKGASETAKTVAKADSKSTDDDHHDEAHGEDHGHHGWQHYLSMHFLINEIFMVIFFGIAAKEITESCLPGGALNPVSKAINPLLGTIGGVLGPVGAYLLLNSIIGQSEWQNGWGIPTATDIALAWLVARMVFGAGHSAISFLLLLAVADDGIGLGIIAFAYPDANNPTEWIQTLWVVPGMIVAFGLRLANVRNWIPYIVIGGAFAWWGLYSAHLHPALALVPIVPFLPAGKKDDGMFKEEAGEPEDNPLDKFEHDLKSFVDFGLFFFAYANAGVAFGAINNLTWIVLLSLLVGKTIGITFFSYVGTLIGFPLPDGMKLKHLVVAGLIAGLGLTVALFVSGEAFQGTSEAIMNTQGAAKMGALFSGGAAILALILGAVLGVKDGGSDDDGHPEQH